METSAAKNNTADRIPAATRRYTTPSSTSFTVDPNEQRKLLSLTPAGIPWPPMRRADLRRVNSHAPAGTLDIDPLTLLTLSSTAWSNALKDDTTEGLPKPAA
jgi:hypothetical protein